jgi:cyanophycin synthetase
LLGQLQESRVQAAVQECHFGRIARMGFPWQRCDIGVVTNVTPDHIGRVGVDSLEEMAELKRSVADRADKVVLNGDDPHCLAMIPKLEGKQLCLTTLGSDVEGLLARAGRPAAVITVETRDDRDWLLLHDGGQRIGLVAVNDIPATMQGAAAHNVSNAQMAAAAAWLAGLEPERIGASLAGFEMSFENTPGRLNLHDNGRFRVIMDYAHNEDGFRKFAQFADSLECEGRKILLYAVSMEVSDQMVTEAAAIPAGHFDYYICKNYSSQDEREPEEVPGLMQQSLEAEGVSPDNITQIPDDEEALDHALGMCTDGDLLFVLTGRTVFAGTWEKILAV